MRTAVLTVEYPSRASYYQDWRDAFLAAPGLSASAVNLMAAGARAAVARAAREAELIVALHAVTADTLAHAAPVADALADRRGRLVAFVGNELNSPLAPLGAKIAWLRRVRPDIVATQLLQEA
ncbi:MAG: hypothetical protein JNK11_21360, partial [Alphaproteobacteria bacterium]|nr:hypothetical protein [Alphaproteobacteria bacterium]